ncbi:VOC family protein [Tumebacillus algifaecis]|uniref:VOC family protein n=1 Tax=Tumebacillus algifaecis TaxID=1214604 RepID=UPI001D13256A|nr:VOC family protein [Tumebacillus algifaecis]
MHRIVDVDEVLFFVQDVSEAKRWYMKVFETSPTFDDPNYCTFQLGRVTIGLHPADAKTSAGVAGQVVYWRVEDLQSSIAHFEAHGCTLFRGPILGIDGVHVCQLQDPFGNVWGLVEKKA